MSDLDEYQAFQLDLAMAWKGKLRDKEELNTVLHTLLEGMRGIMKSQGAQVQKIPAPAPLVKGEHDDELPSLRAILKYAGGSGVKVEQ